MSSIRYNSTLTFITPTIVQTLTIRFFFLSLSTLYSQSWFCLGYRGLKPPSHAFTCRSQPGKTKVSISFLSIKQTSKVQNKGAHLFFGQKQPHNGHIFRVAKCPIFYTAWFVTDKVYPVNSFKLFTCQNLLKIKCCQFLKLRHLVFKILKRH